MRSTKAVVKSPGKGVIRGGVGATNPGCSVIRDGGSFTCGGESFLRDILNVTRRRGSVI